MYFCFTSGTPFILVAVAQLKQLSVIFSRSDLICFLRTDPEKSHHFTNYPYFLNWLNDLAFWNCHNKIWLRIDEHKIEMIKIQSTKIDVWVNLTFNRARTNLICQKQSFYGIQIIQLLIPLTNIWYELNWFFSLPKCSYFLLLNYF